jgi:small GTP-binding protein
MVPARKICLLGDFAVGKTSLVRRYVHDLFADDYRATIGVGITQHRAELGSAGTPHPLDLIIWDIEGSEFGRELVTSYLVGAAGALVVGDITRADALASMAAHAEILAGQLPGRPLVFALNKADRVEPAGWPDGQALTARHGGLLRCCSAKTGEAVPELFVALGRRILELGV